MALRKTSSAIAVNTEISSRDWLKDTSKLRGGAQVKVASEALSKYDPSRWLLSHVTIMASVDLEEAIPGDPKSAYLIKPEHEIFVNNNGDCWERELLAKTYKTFLGANNYVEHVQLPEHSKGKVIDVALREIDLGIDSKGNKCTTYYVDLLIATSWEFPDICSKILTGEYNAVSMGCLIQYSTCSHCGNVAKDESEHCEHIQYFRRNAFYDKNGIKRIVAEICGDKNDPSSVTFMDASWVRKPAFPGAVIRNIVTPPKNLEAKLRSFDRGSEDPLMAHVKGKTLIKTDHHDVEAFAKAASLKKADDDDGAARFGEVPEEKSDEEFPAPEEGSEEGAEEGGGLFGGEEGGDAPAEEPGTTPEEANATPFQSIKDDIQKNVLTQIKQQLMDQVHNLVAVKTPGDEVGEMNADTESIFRQTDSLMKEASSPHTAKYLNEKYSVDIKTIQNVRLAASLMAMASVPKLTDISKLGFTRKDAAQVLKFVDERRNGPAIGDDVVKHIVENPDVKGKDFLLKFIIENLRRPSEREKNVLNTWPTMLEGI